MKGKREKMEQTEITKCTERFMVSIFPFIPLFLFVPFSLS